MYLYISKKLKIMETKSLRISTSFRLPADVLSALKEQAKQANRSLNNYVECILINALGNSAAKPNEETLAAIEEARHGHTKAVDVSCYDAFVNSIFGNEED